LGRVAHHQAEANALIQAQAKADWCQCRGDTAEQLNLSTLTALAPIRQRYLLRFWIKQLGLPVPSTHDIQRVLEEVVTARGDRQPLVRWRGGEIRRYRHHLFAMPNLPTTPQCLVLDWLLPTQRRLPWGWLMACPTKKTGLVIPKGTGLQVRFRQGGEKFYQHGQHHTVKKLLQAIHLPPWLRPFLPLIYLNDQLIVIPEVGVCDAFKGQKADSCWIIQWHYSTLEGPMDSAV
jgi:tRNA(Ile)-lysidine synthase